MYYYDARSAFINTLVKLTESGNRWYGGNEIGYGTVFEPFEVDISHSPIILTIKYNNIVENLLESEFPNLKTLYHTVRESLPNMDAKIIEFLNKHTER